MANRVRSPSGRGDTQAYVTGQGPFIERTQHAVATPEVGFIGSVAGVKNRRVSMHVVGCVICMTLDAILSCFV